MYKFPLLDNNQNPITKLLDGTNQRAREFNNIYKLNLNDEMIKPLSYNNPQGVPIGTYSKLGLDNMSLENIQKNIFSNNFDPTEEVQTTMDLNQQYLQDVYNNQPPLSEKEQQIAPYLNTPYSPELRDLMVKQSIQANTNNFFLESQDFVKEYQDSINNMYAEANLFDPKDNSTATISKLLNKQIQLQNINNMLLEKQTNLENAKNIRFKNKMNMNQY